MNMLLRSQPFTQKFGQQIVSSLPKLPEIERSFPVYQGPDFEKIKKLRSEHSNPVVYTYYQNPLAIVRGHMQYLFDEKGRRYLDGIAGICVTNVGHCHPQLVQAGKKQMETLMHATTAYMNDQHVLFLDELQRELPKELSHIYLVNSGSEANDLGILNARIFTGCNTIISLRHGYHGMVGTAMDLTSLSTWKYPVPIGSDIQRVAPPYLYRGPTDDVNFYINEVSEVIKTNTSGKIAGFIAESALGAGGYVFWPKGYLQGVYKHVRGAGGICIADEVQTGFGRTGTMFNFTKQDVVPDMVILAKGIGGGIPMAAVATRQDIAQSLQCRVHFNTFGGNPLSCAIARANLRILQDERLVENSATQGDYILSQMKNWVDQYQFVGEVRGQGLMIAIEFVKDQKSQEPDTNITALILERSKEYGLLLGKAGLVPNIVRVAPPLCINRQDAKFIVDVLANCLEDYASGRLQ